jgi:hypothetical protein
MTIENRSASAEETWLGESSELSKSDPITTAARAWRAGDRATGRYSDTSSVRASGAAPPSRVTNSRHLKLSYRIGACQAGVCAENLDPAILVMTLSLRRKSSAKVSNGVAGLAAGGSSLDRKKSRQFVPYSDAARRPNVGAERLLKIATARNPSCVSPMPQLKRE